MASYNAGHRGTYSTQMLLDTLLARATGLPGFKFWRGLAPRRFLIDHLLAEVIKATEVLPADDATGLFAVITTSPLGLPEILPADWSEVDRLGDYFATYQVPAGSTTRQVIETLALELITLFYPSDSYENQLFAWLEIELGPDQDEDEEGAFAGGSAPDAPGPCSTFDIPSPRDYLNPRSEEQQDLDFLYGSGRTPPQYHGYNDCSPQHDPTHGPPEVSDIDIQAAEEHAFYFG